MIDDSDLSGLIIDLYEILKENGMDSKGSESIMVDFITSLENHMFISSDETNALTECYDHDIVLDDALNKYFDSVESVENYMDEDDEELYEDM